MRKDILLVMSDQHSQMYTQFEDGRIDMPSLERIASQGLRFDRCYCNAPLCVPSRMSFLSGKLPSELEIFNNDAVLPGDVPTIAHALGAGGYHTVLIGRMHFKGDEQKHGFDERLAGDITSQYWGTGGAQRTDMGAYVETTNRRHCLDVIGGGYSPVMAFDDLVFETAMEFLRNRNRDGRPLFLVVGFYGPHFPFVCRPDLYQKYKERFSGDVWPEYECGEEYYGSRMEVSPKQAAHCRAAYCGQVEALDEKTGRLYDAFVEGRENYLFFYTSDHGEQLGKRGLFGKTALYEDAIRVPLIMEGTGVKTGILSHQVSLLDVSKTILTMAGVDSSWHDGRGLLEKGPVVIQQILKGPKGDVMAEGVISMPYKAVRYQGGSVRVYDLESDPWETKDMAKECPSFLQEAKTWMLKPEQLARCLRTEDKQTQQQELLKAWGREKKPYEWATMKIPDSARQKPVE